MDTYKPVRVASKNRVLVFLHVLFEDEILCPGLRRGNCVRTGFKAMNTRSMLRVLHPIIAVVGKLSTDGSHGAELKTAPFPSVFARLRGACRSLSAAVVRSTSRDVEPHLLLLAEAVAPGWTLC